MERWIDRVLRVVVAGPLLLFAAVAAQAQAYPDKPIRILVGAGAGTVTDQAARTLSEKAAVLLGQPIVVENRPGASATLAAQAVARAAPDGYTLLFGANQTHATNMVVLKNPGYDPIRDFTPVARLVVNSQVLVVNKHLGVNSVAELLALAKAKPGTLSFASSGKGTTAHLAGELLKSAAGLDLVHVPYNNAQIFVDMIAGRTSMMVYPYIAVKQYIDGGQMTPLATFGAKRPPWMPNVPTMAESGFPDFNLVTWFAIYGPARLPADVTNKLSAAFRDVLADPAIAARMISSGSEPAYADPAELASFTRSEIERVRRIVTNARLTFDD